MMAQETLPFARGSATSKAAAESSRERAQRNRERVLDVLRAAGADGMTCDEIEIALDGSHQAISPRVTELAKSGAIVPAMSDGKPRTRPTRSGARFKAVVYTVRP